MHPEAVGVAVGMGVADVLPWFGVGSTLLLARFAVVLLRRERAPKQTPRTRAVAWAALAVGAVVPVAVLAAARQPPLSLPGWFDPSALWAQSWPLLLGLALAVVAWGSARRSSRPVPSVPPGDIVVLEERAARGLVRALTAGSEALGRVRGAAVARIVAGPKPGPVVERVQRAIASWRGSGVVLVIALAVVLCAAVFANGGGTP
ncbi:hypothetical protein [Microbacterium thalli]|uniref:Uncharacterized protein n=1 Tax=Microbacterium thalli TaxID=3027921 RepID=A0ABT5SP12_9MICO|nr:hypothetical protein [Microbacterium thalli]MDD7963528.1 hypothetical protein [Microbacterium thalli]